MPIDAAFIDNTVFIDLCRMTCSSRFFLVSRSSTTEPLTCLFDAAGSLLYHPGLTSNAADSLQRQTITQRVTAELQRSLQRDVAWESVVRVRASRGMTIASIQGSFSFRNQDLLGTPCFNENQSICFELRTDTQHQLVSQSLVCVQAALLYTSSTGERRIRVHTMALPVAQFAQQLLETLNPLSYMVYSVRQTLPLLYGQGFEIAREALRNRCIKLVSSHRQFIMQQSTQQVRKRMPLPIFSLNYSFQSADSAPHRLTQRSMDSMSMIPVYTLGAIKCLALRDAADLRIDQRTDALFQLSAIVPTHAELLLRPRMWSLLPLLDGTASQPQPLIDLTMASVASCPLVLLDNGFEIMIRVARTCDLSLLAQRFGLTNLDPDAVYGEQITGSLGSFIASLRSSLHTISHRYQPVIIVKEGESTDLKFLQQLVEDRSPSAGHCVNPRNHQGLAELIGAITGHQTAPVAR